MQKITTATELKYAIQQLEYKQAIEWPLLQEQILFTYENLKLSNIIKSTIKEVITAPDLKTDAMNAVIGVATGIVAKVFFIGKTHNPLSYLLGIITEIAVANKAFKNANGIKSIAGAILKKIGNHQSDSKKV